MNDIFVELQESTIDSDIKFYKEFTTAIGRKDFHVKGFLTWSLSHHLDVPGKTTLNQLAHATNYTCFPQSVVIFHLMRIMIITYKVGLKTSNPQLN